MATDTGRHAQMPDVELGYCDCEDRNEGRTLTGRMALRRHIHSEFRPSSRERERESNFTGSGIGMSTAIAHVVILAAVKQ